MHIPSSPLALLSALSLLTTSVLAVPAPLEPGTSLKQLYLPDDDPLIYQRLQEIRTFEKGFLYGPSLLGNMSFFPTGQLGDPIVARDIAQWRKAAAPQSKNVDEDIPVVVEAIRRAGGLTSLESYNLIHDGQWKKSNPTGIAPGYLTNYTQDLFFAMERLAGNPYAVRRAKVDETLPYTLEDQTVSNIVGDGWTLEKLHKEGRLFIADHSYQLEYQQWIQANRYAAACTAYFYIHPTKKQFLPLSIKTNIGADLIYTPLDTTNDWLLAKIMFSSNDLFHGQSYHLASSHCVAEIVHEAAVRTMSTRHPIRAYLDRIMYQAYAIRPLGTQILFNPGGAYDQSFPYTNDAVRRFATVSYQTDSGKFRANYLLNNLANRGLINSKSGPPLPHFPFQEDSLKIVKSLRKFYTVLIDHYYPRDTDVFQDNEVQAWAIEAVDEANTLDFPEYPLTKASLVDILTHMSYLTGLNHHALNSATPSATSGTLPLHPSSLYAPLPVQKGVNNLLPFLPNLTQAITQVSLLTRFNRPHVTDEDGGGALVDMFEDPGLIKVSPRKIRAAAGVFRKEMIKLGEKIKGREFDDKGLSQGAPFVWRGLDPMEIPFYLSV